MFKVLLGEDAVELGAKCRIRTVSASSLNVVASFLLSLILAFKYTRFLSAQMTKDAVQTCFYSFGLPGISDIILKTWKGCLFPLCCFPVAFFLAYRHDILSLSGSFSCRYAVGVEKQFTLYFRA